MTIGHFASAVITTTGLCDAGTSAIPRLHSTEINPTHAFGGARWDSNGDVFYYDEGEPDFTDFPATPNGGTWIGNCPASKYEGRWIKLSGLSVDEPNKNVEPAKDVWRAMDLGPINVEWDTTSNDNGELEFQLRRISNQVVILTDAFIFDIESDDP